LFRCNAVNCFFRRFLLHPHFAYDLRAFMYNRLKQIGKYEHPANPPPTYSIFYSLGYRTFKVAEVYLYPLANVKTKNMMGFSQGLSLFTIAGREQIYKKLRPDLRHEIYVLTTSSNPNQSVEYMDNRISRYSMKMGKCEITGDHIKYLPIVTDS
jgi:RNA-directed DNA polymerase